jgi:hypothetical protein
VSITGTAPALSFAVQDAQSVPYAAVPTIAFALRIAAAPGQTVRSVLLDTQVQIAARRRSYGAEEHDRLFELFGAPAAWKDTLRTLLWARTTLVVPPFSEETVATLPVTCTYDLEVTAARYFDALPDGDVPLEFMFSGTVFYSAEDGRLQTMRLSWDQEAEYRLPVRVWRETMERHFPGAAWLRLQRGAFDRIATYKSRHALPTWDAALDRLLDEAGE